MPYTKQAAKRQRQSLVNKSRNRIHKASLRTDIKKYNAALDEGDKDSATTQLTDVLSKLDRTGKKGIIHTKTADRLKSRLTLRYNKTFA